MPLPLLLVLGVGVADATLLLSVAEPWLDEVVLELVVVAFSAVLEELDDDLPACEAAAA